MSNALRGEDPSRGRIHEPPNIFSGAGKIASAQFGGGEARPQEQGPLARVGGDKDPSTWHPAERE